jgi:hypothetical protein
MSEPTLIGEVAVSRDARVKVRVGRRGGRDLVDLRLFREDGGLGSSTGRPRAGSRLSAGPSQR